MLSILALSATAHADPRAEADRLLAEGKALGEAGRAADAIQKFREAERLLPRAVHRCNIGLAYVKLGKLPLALLYLERCRAGARSFPPWLAQRQGEVASQLAATHAPVEIRITPSEASISVSALDAGEPLRSGERVFLPQGEWRVAAQHDGYLPGETIVRVKNLAGQQVELVLEPHPAARVEQSAAPEVRSLQHSAARPASTARRIAPWFALGAGVVSAGAGVLFHLRSLEARRDAVALHAGSEFDDRKADYRRNGWLAAGAYTMGAVGVGLGVYLLLRGRDYNDAAVEVSLHGSGAMVSLSLAR